MISQLGVICLQETWLDSRPDICHFNILNYKLVHQGKTKCSEHGGLITLVHDRFSVSAPIKLLDVMTGWEYLCIEITQMHPYHKKYTIANVYRPPHKLMVEFDIFLEEFDQFINNLAKLKHSVYINGDFNIDLLKIHAVQHYSMFFDNIISSGFYPRITLRRA